MDITVLMKDLSDESTTFSSLINNINSNIKKSNYDLAASYANIDKKLLNDVSQNCFIVSALFKTDSSLLYDVISQKYLRLNCGIVSLSNYYTIMHAAVAKSEEYLKNHRFINPVLTRSDEETILFIRLNIDMPFFLNLIQTKNVNKELEEIVKKYNI